MADTIALSLFAAPGSQGLASTSSSGRLVTGREKLGERVVLEVLTSRGSLRFLPHRGTVFLDLAGGGRALSELDAFAAFSTAALDAVANLRGEESTADPNDTRIAGARMTGLTITATDVAATVSVTTRAGASTAATVFLAGDVPDGRAAFSPD